MRVAGTGSGAALPPVAESELHAFIDGALAPDRAAAVARHLAAHPADAARVAAWRAQGEAIRAAFAPVLAEPVPERLHSAVAAGPQGAFAVDAVLARWAPRAAAAAILLALGGAVGWLARDAALTAPRAPEAASHFTAEAQAAHRMYVAEPRHPVEVRAHEPHLLTWLSRRIGTTLVAPDLTAAGYMLMGGRLLPSVDGKAAAQFMYENAEAKQRMTLYLRRDEAAGPGAATAGGTGFRFVQDGAFSGFSWVDNGLGYALFGTLDRPALQRLADIVYRQLEKKP